MKINIKKQCCSISLVLFSIFAINAQILTPAKWSTSVSKEKIKKGDVVELIFKIKLDDTWHLYSNVQNYEVGPKKTEFEFEPNDTYELVGNTKAIGTKTEYDDIFEVNVTYFEKTGEFRQKVKILKSKAVIEGTYNYQVCTTVDGKCILGDDDFEFKIN
jgi:thiol:disulfide interchange protein DsbD